MKALALAGPPVARQLRETTGANVRELHGRGITPRLAVVLATDNEATLWYVRSIARAAEKAGVECEVLDLGATAQAGEIAAVLRGLSTDDNTHGIILQTPLPPGVSADGLAAEISVDKDIDGANPLSLGRLTAGLPAFAPATARAVVEVLDHYGFPLAGKSVAVVGRSTVVGKPLLQLLLHRDAAVTVCHSRSQPLGRYTRDADVVVAAAGRAGLLTGSDIRPGAVVVDVGTNVQEDGQLVGDADPASVGEVAAALSPVPGGVGTVTTALLVLHTTEAALARARQPSLAASSPGGAGGHA
ncbi:bifunctional protein FolD [Zafaria cholistanensis]|uniref:Bifunctional protein FolD n=1 Tax=Zafaria cholistanensis TaxID=1682741 RepID=A0A5A7NU21_9MICC|nr:bifunctional 5,10-methylenetetrahydrofolate dehydrogenase/5,10-methenyltetrahydrofolate cyclohydrolase [Zafaria cholistanensis]GER23337.1 bifunctional protein FolD [Zafaria cholistanensis]